MLKDMLRDLSYEALQSFIEWVRECPESRQITIKIGGINYDTFKHDAPIETIAWDAEAGTHQYNFSNASEIYLDVAAKESKRRMLRLLQEEAAKGVF